MAAKTRKTSKGVRVALDTKSGQTLTCVVPLDRVEKARELYVAYREAEAAEQIGIASWKEREDAENAWSEFIAEVRTSAFDSDYEGDEDLWNAVEGAFIDAFKDRFERGL